MRFIKICLLGMMVLLTATVATGAHKKGDVLIISDLTDLIYLYHEISATTINAEEFLKNTPIGFSLEWAQSGFSNLAQGYLQSKDVFEKKEYLDAAKIEIPKHKPTFAGNTIGIWKYVQLSPFDFDTNSFTIKFPDKKKTTISSKKYRVVWEYPSEQHKYTVESIEEAKLIERISVEAANRQFGRKRNLSALFYFDIENTTNKRKNKYTNLKLKKVEVYKPNTKRISFNKENSLLFSFTL